MLLFLVNGILILPQTTTRMRPKSLEGRHMTREMNVRTAVQMIHPG